MKLEYDINGKSYTIELTPTDEGYLAKIGEESFPVKILGSNDGHFQLLIDGERVISHWALDGPRNRWVGFEGHSTFIQKSLGTAQRGAEGGGENILLAPMPGQVREVLAMIGEEVSQGQTLLLLEAMKMEIRILAPKSGKLVKLPVAVGDQVEKDALLAELE